MPGLTAVLFPEQPALPALWSIPRAWALVSTLKPAFLISFHANPISSSKVGSRASDRVLKYSLLSMLDLPFSSVSWYTPQE